MSDQGLGDAAEGQGDAAGEVLQIQVSPKTIWQVGSAGCLATVLHGVS